MKVTLDFKTPDQLPDHQGKVIAITNDGETIFTSFYDGHGWQDKIIMWAEKPTFKTKTVLDMGEQ